MEEVLELDWVSGVREDIIDVDGLVNVVRTEGVDCCLADFFKLCLADKGGIHNKLWGPCSQHWPQGACCQHWDMPTLLGPNIGPKGLGPNVGNKALGPNVGTKDLGPNVGIKGSRVKKKLTKISLPTTFCPRWDLNQSCWVSGMLEKTFTY